MFNDSQFKKAPYCVPKYDEFTDAKYDRTKLGLRCAICEVSKKNCKHTKAFYSTEKTDVLTRIKNHLFQKHYTKHEVFDDFNKFVSNNLEDNSNPKIKDVLTVLGKIDEALEKNRMIEEIPEVLIWDILVK